MSFLKEIITQMEGIPGSERIIERIMALVDGDIERDIDVSVMQEITKIIEEETGISAEDAMAAEDEYSEGDSAEDEPESSPETPFEFVVDTDVNPTASAEVVDAFVEDVIESIEVEESAEGVAVEPDEDIWGWGADDDTDTQTAKVEESNTPHTSDDGAETFVSPEDEFGVESTTQQMEAEESEQTEESAPDEEDRLFKQAIYLIKKMLDDKGYTYSESKRAEDVYVIKFGVRYDYCRLNADVFIEKDPLVCFIRIGLPIACDPIYYPVLSEHLAGLNRKSSRYGTYAIDFDDGSVECRFRLRYDDGLGIKAFQKMLFFSLGDADDEYPEISRISAGKLKREKREDVVKKAKALIDDIEGE